MRNKNILTSLVLLAFSVYAWFEVKDLPLISNFFPKVCIVFLAFLSILLLIQALRIKNIQEKQDKKNLKYVKLLVFGITIYILLIFIIGFNLGSILFLGLFGYIFDPIKTKKKCYLFFWHSNFGNYHFLCCVWCFFQCTFTRRYDNRSFELAPIVLFSERKNVKYAW